MLHHVFHKALFLHVLKLLIRFLLMLWIFICVIIYLVKLNKLLFFGHLRELLLQLLLQLKLHLLMHSHLFYFVY